MLMTPHTLGACAFQFGGMYWNADDCLLRYMTYSSIASFSSESLTFFEDDNMSLKCDNARSTDASVTPNYSTTTFSLSLQLNEKVDEDLQENRWSTLHLTCSPTSFPPLMSL
jgi:hypothetical protein